MHNAARVFCGDDVLGYGRSRTRFQPGEELRLDETYRFAHLPLVAPDHPDAIAAHPERGYAMGRHAPVFSLVAPVDGEALAASPMYRRLERELRASPFADKVAWNLLPRRRSRLHATICGSLAVDQAPDLPADSRTELARIGPIGCRLQGLFSGNVNVGRLYLKAYPECRSGENLFRQVQRSFRRPETDLFVVGLFNLTDHLGPHEAAALSRLLDEWWDVPILEFEIDRLWLLRASDDLVLDSEIAETLALRKGVS